MSQLIGIDLGTTNSILAYLKGGPEVINIKGRTSLPSVVAHDGDDFLVGQSAKN
ncbi:MAG: Hsp70 family protein, partial [Planctomycetota bacterium]